MSVDNVHTPTETDDTILIEEPVKRLVILKGVVSWVTGAGVGTIVHAIIDNNVAVETRIQRITLPIASAVIAYAAKDASRQFTDAKIDELADEFGKAIAFIKNVQ